MKISALLLILPFTVAAQNSSSIAARVTALLASGVSGATEGVYLKQAGGTVVANQQENFVFAPGTGAELVTLLEALQQVESRALSLDSAITHYDNLPASCPSPLIPDGTEPLSTALREMMWRSDNVRATALQNFFGTAKLNDFAVSLGMTKTSLPAAPGCASQTPGQMTLVDAARLLEGVESGNLLAAKSAFHNFLAGKAQAAIETVDASRIWSADIPAMIRQESPAGTTAAQQAVFQSSMDLGYKTGAVIVCTTSDCTHVSESLSIAGWARVPYCAGSTNGSRDFIFGEFIANAVDTSWSLGKITAAETAFASAKAELLREQVRAGLASCYATSPVMVDPTPGSVLPGRTVTFTWSPGSGWDGYRLDIGLTAAGSELASIPTTAPQALVTNLPCDGRKLYVRLWSHNGTYQNPIDYPYTACTNGGPQLTSPPPGANLFASTLTFTWSAVGGADSYRLDLGNRPGASDIASVTVTGTSTAVSNIPTDGRIIYARIVAHTATGFLTPNDYSYNNFFAQTPVISSIVNAVLPTANISSGMPVVLTGVNFAADAVVAIGNQRATIVGTPTATQITVLVPPGLGIGTVPVQVAAGGLVGPPSSVALVAASPTLYPRILDASGAVVNGAVQPGDALAIQAVGLGPFASNGMPGLGLTVRIGAAHVSATVKSVAPVLSSPGVYQINFVVPIGTPSGSQPLDVTVGTAVSNALTIRIVGPAVNAVLNAANFATNAKVAPGSLVSIFGDSLATGDAFGVYPSASLPGGGSITINGVSAPLFDVVASQGQVNLLVPFETPATGSVPVVVTNSAGTSAAYSLAMAPAAPGIFRIPDPSNPKRSNAAALLANTAWRVLPTSMAVALGMPQECKANNVPVAAICGQPASPGDPIQIYATGLGRATPNGAPFGNSLRTGDVAPADGRTLYQTVETPRVTVGGIDAQVVFSGMAPGFAGLYQVNVVIPGGAPAGDDVPVVVTIGGASDQATIAIRAR
jgi:uncharacterized protein (TIGR03437 family)